MWQMAKTGNSLISPLITFCKIWLKLKRETGKSSLVKILTSEIIQSTQNETELKEFDMKSTLNMQLLGPQIPNFQLFRSTISRTLTF